MSRGGIIYQPVMSQEGYPACRDHRSPSILRFNFPSAVSLIILLLLGHNTALGAWSTMVLTGIARKSSGQGRCVSGPAGGFRFRATEAQDANGSTPDGDAVQKKPEPGKGGDA